MPQRAVHGEGIRAHLDVEALRQHHLIDVAGGDVLLRRAHAVFELLARRMRRHPRRLGPAGDRRLRQRPLQLALQELDARARELIERLEISLPA